MSTIKNIIVVFVLFCVSNFQITAQDNAKKPKQVNVVVMPYDRYERYPFATDMIREFLQLGLKEKGFSVVSDDPTWLSILDKDYPLYNLSQEQAESIINDIDADLIVFGFSDNSISSRNYGLYNDRPMSKPILVKVYDKNKKSLVLYERVNFYEYWGLFVKQLDLNEFSVQIANKLKQIGY
ncbi:MAG: hypothetical protein FIA82_00880 [Melioribacter sp.]|nr:hypothetical protein [Melioribacter sp.]